MFCPWDTILTITIFICHLIHVTAGMNSDGVTTRKLFIVSIGGMAFCGIIIILHIILDPSSLLFIGLFITLMINSIMFLSWAFGIVYDVLD